MDILTEYQLQEWLANETLEDIIEMNNLTEEEVLTFLWEAGLIELPAWLEDRNVFDEDEL